MPFPRSPRILRLNYESGLVLTANRAKHAETNRKKDSGERDISRFLCALRLNGNCGFDFTCEVRKKREDKPREGFNRVRFHPLRAV